MITSLESGKVVVIGGSDPTGGAGVSRDAATLASVGVTPIVIVSAVTVQDADGVKAIQGSDPDLVRAQLQVALLQSPGALKAGMLFSQELTLEIAEVLKGHFTKAGVIPLVLDPVLFATSGGALSTAGLLDSLIALQPVTTLITPNLQEARAILKNETLEAEQAAQALCEAGWRASLVTGGEQDATDVLAVDGEILRLYGQRYPVSVRGTGCALASYIAAGLARKIELVEACRIAKGRISRAISRSTAGYLSLLEEPVWPGAGHPFE
jgi:hydroxymethylpyrimidine/phosphomethylpyrimidine kinase